MTQLLIGIAQIPIDIFAGVPRSPNPEKEQQNIISVVLSKEIVPIDERIAQRAGRLHGELDNDGTPVDMHDCLIAATSIDFEEPVVTRNVDHFEVLLTLLSASIDVIDEEISSRDARQRVYYLTTDDREGS